MFTVQPIQMPLAGAAIARPDLSSVQSVTAVAPAGNSAGGRNDLTRDPGADAERAARLIAQLRRDPSTPAGPPPAFKANVLEVERARLLAPPDLLAEPPEAGTEVAPGQDRPDEAGEPAKTGSREARETGARDESEAPKRAYEETRKETPPPSVDEVA